MQLYSIDTGYFKLDGGAMFGVVPKSIWNKINAADENNLCNWAMRCLLVEEGDRLVLIDCGLGNKQSERFFSHYEPHGSKNLETSLKEFGFNSDDITDVFLTHLHFDHCGGAIRYDEQHKLVPAFRNATYYSCEQHWLAATQPNQREKASFLKENILPIQESGQLKMLSEGDQLFPGFRTLFVHGHTDAMMIPLIDYKGKTIAYMADLIPSAGHIPIPYVMAYDIRPLISLQEKESFLNTAYDHHYSLFFEHDPNIELCNLVKTDRGIRMGAEMKVADL